MAGSPSSHPGSPILIAAQGSDGSSPNAARITAFWSAPGWSCTASQTSAAREVAARAAPNACLLCHPRLSLPCAALPNS
eukprot:475218-Rhodomonas_salina.1